MTAVACQLRHRLDLGEDIAAPTSSKSTTEQYGFGHRSNFAYTEDRQPCRDRDPLKKAFFGDLHVHTALSADAFPEGTRVFPDDAYRFARGEAIAVPGVDAAGAKMIRLARPLDFVAVTDHSEALGEGYICRTPGAFPGYDSRACRKFRRGGTPGLRVFFTELAKPVPQRNESVCGEGGGDCAAAQRIVWRDIVMAAERAYDRSASCRFTSFVGYEYTRMADTGHKHRNVVFRNASVPETPAGAISHPHAWRLLSSLESQCRRDLEDCDAISIPHNSNISGGNAFNTRETEGFSDASREAYDALRHSFDRLMEIVQNKGASECINGTTDILGDTDELCDVEAIRQFGAKSRGFELSGLIPRFFTSRSEECAERHFNSFLNRYQDFCLSSRDFARGALLAGMAHARRYGVNPFEFGFVGSSDTHIGAAGMTEEGEWVGHVPGEIDPEFRLASPTQLGRYNQLISNPGGLAGLWAEENSRDALFHSMKRREAFGTSGTRIAPRFFVGTYPDDICDRPDRLEIAYREGTPMGSALAATHKPFRLAAWAQRDPMSASLAKLQIVKGWIEAGTKRNQVFDVAVSAGADGLCTSFVDEDYDPEMPTYYYLRVVETPTRRWSAIACEQFTTDRKPRSCEQNETEFIREMAWTSPIWFGSHDSHDHVENHETAHHHH